MTPLEPLYFIDGGHQWVTECWVNADGVVCCENTHPIYDAEGNPVPAV
jgi:hypothetical protein